MASTTDAAFVEDIEVEQEFRARVRNLKKANPTAITKTRHCWVLRGTTMGVRMAMEMTTKKKNGQETPTFEVFPGGSGPRYAQRVPCTQRSLADSHRYSGYCHPSYCSP
jgi:hypothetical protein